MKQLKAKLTTTAATEIRLLTAPERRVSNMISVAEISGASRTYHGSMLFIARI
jgi:hypothetical protein